MHLPGTYVDLRFFFPLRFSFRFTLRFRFRTELGPIVHHVLNDRLVEIITNAVSCAGVHFRASRKPEPPGNLSVQLADLI